MPRLTPAEKEAKALEIRNFRETLLEVIKNPETAEAICGHVANGGDMIALCEMWHIRYSDVINWLSQDKERWGRYQASLVARDEWLTQKAMAELFRIGDSDLREAFNPDGSMKHPSAWPESLAKSVMSIEVDELWGPDGEGGKEQIGVTKKIKLWPKIEALKLQMQKLGILVERKQVEHTFSVAGKMAELQEARKRAKTAVEAAIDVSPGSVVPITPELPALPLEAPAP